jgi:(2Fe-2S) ferredoxin
VYPQGIWYGQVQVKDVEEIVDQHIVGGKPVERLLLSNLMVTMGG